VGNWKLKNGDISKYYFDIKNIISTPKLLIKVGDELYKKLGDFDIICGVPYGGLPIATYISTKYNKPLIYVRDKVKEYGTGKLIEGEYKKTDRCVILDDVVTSGGSMEETIKILQDKVTIVQAAVILDRQQKCCCSMPITALLYKNDIVKYRLKKISEMKGSNLCFSADIEDPHALIKMLELIGKYIVVCKIHYDIINVSAMGESDNFKKELINLSIKHDFLIMEDRKFIDISYIVQKQYTQFNNWIDLVTVHSSVTDETVSKLSGVLLVANMSNNNYDLSEKALSLAENNPNNVVGFITQNRISCNDLICMTPGISCNTSQVEDQKYRSIATVDTDYIIVGRALYQSTDIIKTMENYVTLTNLD
jgi:uridine monophosphate synthetase